MNDIQSIFNIYLAYPTCRDDSNFYRAIKNYTMIGTEIKAYLIDWEKMDGLPKINLYVPAEHELFIQQAYLDNVLTSKQILSINHKIILACNLVVVFGNFKTNNKDLLSLVQYARKNKVAVYTMPGLSLDVINTLKLAIMTIIKAGD